ncbi:hypothetical protein FVE85_7032 [Porphyridium purpureum]|uniref:DUF985 domain-containing protein n=1 Tax=Porphyridium purpureum TaxID=35688 RepID=A0A5J4Z9Y0_PORPP|nr:hypothetical protein FVE85_7032 [Porphyridium purpureum]|eukprot:POR0369..scf295_1
MGLSAEQVIDQLRLQPLPDEGGMWAQTYLDEHCSAIYFLIRPGDFSALHSLSVTELWHFYAGDPVRMLLLRQTGDAKSSSVAVLGPLLELGQRPCVVVPAGTMMGAETVSSSSGQVGWSLIGTTMAPPFYDARFSLGERSALISAFPEHGDDILRLTR